MTTKSFGLNQWTTVPSPPQGISESNAAPWKHHVDETRLDQSSLGTADDACLRPEANGNGALSSIAGVTWWRAAARTLRAGRRTEENKRA